MWLGRLGFLTVGVESVCNWCVCVEIKRKPTIEGCQRMVIKGLSVTNHWARSVCLLCADMTQTSVMLTDARLTIIWCVFSYLTV